VKTPGIFSPTLWPSCVSTHDVGNHNMGMSRRNVREFRIVSCEWSAFVVLGHPSK